LGPLVIQPERSTSLTAAMVASSIVGFEKGKKGKAEVMGVTLVMLSLWIRLMAAF